MKLRLTIPLCILFLFLIACGERRIEGHGATKTDTRRLGAGTFNKVEIAAPIDAHITIGGAPSLTLEGYGNVLPYLRSEVRNGTLRIFTDEQTDLNTRKNITANITLPALAAFSMSGAGDAVISGNLSGPRFDLELSGAGSVDVQELHVQAFTADLSGAAGLRLRRGDIGAGSFKISGTGNINAFGVTQGTVDLRISGAADAEVNVGSKLDAKISGTGSVRYKGHPAVTQEVSGTGSVTDAN